MSRKQLHKGIGLVVHLIGPIGGAAVVLIGIVLLRTVAYRAKRAPIEPVPAVAIPEGATERLAGAIRIRTISQDDAGAFDASAFSALHAYLKRTFPRVHSQLTREIVGEQSLLYTWNGSDSTRNPILLMGHLDVVPAEAPPERAGRPDNSWQHPPFSGRIADGFVWGRGAIDNKSSVVGMLEAVEMLLQQGFHPSRTVYFAFGHDEEVGGMRGAREMAALLDQRGVELEMIMDEGGVIGQGVFPGTSSPVALVGISEKGFLSVELSTRARGGHSALPPRQSPIGILGAAIAQLENEPMLARFEGATAELFDRIGPTLPFMQRAVFANRWLTRGLVTRKLESSPTTNAMLRTTSVATLFHAGTKDNVLPDHASAVINFRILPGDSTASVLAYVRRTINDPRIDIKAAGRFFAEPSAASSTASEPFQRLERSIRSIHPDVMVAPFLVVVATDSRHFSRLSKHVFRFLPVRVTSSDLARMHGANERISIANYEQLIRTYRQIILDAAGV